MAHFGNNIDDATGLELLMHLCTSLKCFAADKHGANFNKHTAWLLNLQCIIIHLLIIMCHESEYNHNHQM